MKSKRWLQLTVFACMLAHWFFVLTGADEFVVTRWFLAFCVFAAAWGVVAHIDERGDRQ